MRERTIFREVGVLGQIILAKGCFISAFLARLCLIFHGNRKLTVANKWLTLAELCFYRPNYS
jgi:hypothetical protein